jgi:hypothetical protein
MPDSYSLTSWQGRPHLQVQTATFYNLEKVFTYRLVCLNVPPLGDDQACLGPLADVIADHSLNQLILGEGIATDHGTKLILNEMNGEQDSMLHCHASSLSARRSQVSITRVHMPRRGKVIVRSIISLFFVRSCFVPVLDLTPLSLTTR